MIQDKLTGNRLRVGYAVCMRHTNGQLITLWFADSADIADQAVAKLRPYRDQEPQIGIPGQISLGEAFERRDKLRRWRLHHPVGENRSYEVDGFEVLMLPHLDRAKLATLGNLP